MLTVAAMMFTSCSDSYLQEVNTDDSKASFIEPSAQLTTALLQTYGDFSMMDTYRCYITGFTQHLAGGWNVTNFAGSVYADDSNMSPIWNELYGVGIKNIVDAIANSTDKPNTNAALRIQRVLLMSILTDTYGDLPCCHGVILFETTHQVVDTRAERHHNSHYCTKNCRRSENP